MEDSGAIREIDEVGRIVIPKGIRDSKGYGKGSRFGFYLDGDNIILKPIFSDCIFCGERDEEKLSTFMGKLVCYNCKNLIEKEK